MGLPSYRKSSARLSAPRQSDTLYSRLQSIVTSGGDAMKRAAFFASALIIVLGSLSYSTSSDALGTAEQRAACTPDVFRLCSSSIPSVSAIIACMEAKKSQLSPGCRVAFDGPKQAKRAYKTQSYGAAGSAPMATSANQWCDFKGVAHDPAQQDWIKWCGPSARMK